MNDALSTVINEVAKKSILTIGETSVFCEKGGHINFFISASKLKFQINDRALKLANLKISHLLLQNAVIVNTVGEEN